MDEMRWFRVNEQMERLRAEAASDRLARAGRSGERTAREASRRRRTKALPPATVMLDRPCPGADPC